MKRKPRQERKAHATLPSNPPLLLPLPLPLPLPLFSLLSSLFSLCSSGQERQRQEAGRHCCIALRIRDQAQEGTRKKVMMLRRVGVASAPPVPEWLETLLSTRFFLACAAHPASPRNECNMFCIDCRGPAAFCYYCRAHRHAAHRVIQIRRSSYHDVVRVSEVEDVLDITGVQTYVINSARVLFLNERPQPRGAGAAAGKAAASPYNCEICGRALLDPFRFCSLGCKLVDTKRNAAATGEPSNLINQAEAGGSKSRQGRRRKGIPHRAPFWS